MGGNTVPTLSSLDHRALAVSDLEVRVPFQETL